MSDQLCCKKCQESLCGHKYIQVEDGPHCISCYERLYANTCQECKELIGHNTKVEPRRFAPLARKYYWQTDKNTSGQTSNLNPIMHKQTNETHVLPEINKSIYI